MPIRIASPEVVPWEEPADAIRVEFDAWPLLQRAGLPVEEAERNREAFHRLIASEIGEDAEADLRSPGPDVGPHAGGGFYSFIDVVITAGGLVGALEVAGRIATKLRRIDPRAHVSRRGIELLARQQLRFHGHREDSLLVTVEFIAQPVSGPVGTPPELLGMVAVFRLDDGRLVTMRWTLDGVLEDYSEGN